MCGIIGYIGEKNAVAVGIDCLKRLEYRGYDSAGIAFRGKDGAVHCKKAVGKVANLAERIAPGDDGTLAICHTRWATHGGVTEANAHPHADCAGRHWVIHNGIIENYQELKDELLAQGHVFASQTDTEVLPHLIEQIAKDAAAGGTPLPLEEAVRAALRRVRGTYGLLVIDREQPDRIVAARNFSPLLIGVGQGEYFVASDASAVLPHTATVVYLDDGDMAVVTAHGHTVFDMDANVREKALHTIEWSAEEAQKGGHPHFMLKEILEQPEAIENAIRGRMVPAQGLVKLGGLADVHDDLAKAERILLVACGTAYHACRIGEYMIEEYAGIPVETDVASEFRYRKPVFRKNDVFIAFSQSGETADTLGALREAKEKGITTLGVVNVVGSTLARETDAGIYEHVGPEIGVASTKAFLAQGAIAALLAVHLGRTREMSLTMGKRILEELAKVPDHIRTILARRDGIKALAEKYQPYQNFMYLGRKYNAPSALEGALKIKEIAYVHAEGCAAGELKHGQIALIDKTFPSIVIAPQDSVYEKMLSTIQEIRARGGPVLAVATEGDGRVAELADDVIYIPKTLEMLTPLLAVVPLQLFAYYFAAARGLDVDKPRNLAKSVTVE